MDAHSRCEQSFRGALAATLERWMILQNKEMVMIGDQAKFKSACDEWMAVTEESRLFWLDIAQGRRPPDQAAMLELAEKMKRLHTAFVEASLAFTGMAP
jgi:hypothetical protein